MPYNIRHLLAHIEDDKIRKVLELLSENVMTKADVEAFISTSTFAMSSGDGTSEQEVKLTPKVGAANVNFPLDGFIRQG